MYSQILPYPECIKKNYGLPDSEAKQYTNVHSRSRNLYTEIRECVSFLITPHFTNFPPKPLETISFIKVIMKR